MIRLAKWGIYAALGLGVVSAMMVCDDASAQGKKKQPPPAAVVSAPVDPPTVKNRAGISLTPSGMHWGMTSADVITFYDRVIDDDYRPYYKRAQAGPQTERIDADLANTKAAFRRSKVVFGTLPTGVDSTALKGEYTYNNNEAKMHITRRGAGTRHFFFINDKLWKIYDEVELKDDGALGPTYEEALKKQAVQYGVVGRVTQPDYSIGRNFTEVDWQDDKTHLRVLDRSGMKTVGMVYEERATLANLATLRANKPVDQNKIDPEIEALIRPPSPPAGPPPEDKNKPKKK